MGSEMCIRDRSYNLHSSRFDNFRLTPLNLDLQGHIIVIVIVGYISKLKQCDDEKDNHFRNYTRVLIINVQHREV